MAKRASFRPIALLSCVEAIRLIKGLSNATLEQIQQATKGWLKNCPARLQNAAKRNEKTTVQEEERLQGSP
ncbi:uncharacterized protein LOC144109452 isoform X4 [Amblyomma americanum]